MKTVARAEHHIEPRDTDEKENQDRTTGLEDIIALPQNNIGQSMGMSFGRCLTLVTGEKKGSDRLTVSSCDGNVELEINFTKNGPSLRFDVADLQIKSLGKVALNCKEFHVHAERQIKHVSQGDINQQAEGSTIIESKGNLSLRGRSCQVKANRGNVNIKANDDVCAKGERIRLNC